MAGVVVAAVGFFAAFGSLLADQIRNLVTALPGAVEALIDWINATFDLSLDSQRSRRSFRSPRTDRDARRRGPAGCWEPSPGSSVAFSMFTIGLFIFYFRRRPTLQAGGSTAAPTTAGGLPRRVGPGGEKDRRLRRRPHRPGGDQRVTRRTLPAPHRNGLLARPWHLDRGRRPVRPDHRHVHRHRIARRGGAHERRPRWTCWRSGSPSFTSRKSHHRAQDQREWSTCIQQSHSPRPARSARSSASRVPSAPCRSRLWGWRCSRSTAACTNYSRSSTRPPRLLPDKAVWGESAPSL